MLIPTKRNVKTITDMREDALGILKQIEKDGFAYIFHHSKPRAVILNLDEFLAMQELFEDFLDRQDALKLSKEKRGKGISIKEI